MSGVSEWTLNAGRMDTLSETNTPTPTPTPNNFLQVNSDDDGEETIPFNI